MKKQMRRTLIQRTVFVGCQFCGETDMPLKNYGDGKICPRCIEKRNVPDSGTGKEK